MPETALTPRDAEEVAAAIAEAAAAMQPLELKGAGSKRGLGRPVQAGRSLDLSGLAGVTLYEPDELVLSARAGTRLHEIEALLAQNRQQLAFEPGDLGPLYGGPAGAGTIGGALACNLAGPRRIKAGAARDHFLGVVAVNGRGELFKAGGRVVKNVTGYDLCKLLAGSHGTLAAMTDVTVKVLPAPEKTRTLLAFGLDDAAAIRALTAALKSAHEVSGAAHLPASLAALSAVDDVRHAGHAVTAVRVEGFPASVAHRAAAIKTMLAGFAPVEELHSANSRAFWRELRDAAPFVRHAARDLWRLSLPPSRGAEVVARLAARLEVLAYYDWGGGLVWLGLPPSGDAHAAAVRAALADTGGHATLMRAPDGVRAAVDVFEPLAGGLARLSARIKEGFDPCGVLNPGRLYAGAPQPAASGA
ncbi:MAG TPA: glycolate oxidase subunit GlcE [Alphaproteobacteria bacterium]|nr:glycolate oxidase subunit GlcE [Alphaproteobacteria bacterium]